MAKKESSEWKHEIARAERKSRLARMKGTDGHKKKIESRSVGKKLTLTVVAIILVLALATWLVASSGILQKSLTAMYVGERKLTPTDLNMVLGNMTASQQYGLAFDEEFQKLLDGKSSLTEGATIRDDLINQIMPSLSFMYGALNEMDREGYVPTEEQILEIDKNAEALKKQFADMSVQSGRSVSSLLKLYYGPGASIRLVERDLRNSMMISFYEEVIRERADLSDEKMEAFYQEHKDSLDVFSYHAYIFKIEGEDLTADEKKEAVEELAKSLAGAPADLKSLAFEETVVKYVELIYEEAPELDPDAMVFKKVRPSRITSSLLDFLKEADRKAGDAQLVEGSDSVTLVRFDGRMRDDFRPYSVRHILIANDEDAGEDLSDEELEEKAENILAEFLASAKTSDDFAKLVVEHSKDLGSVSNGGLYADVAAGSMVPEFEKWSVEEGRKEGDTGIVKTTYGYHIMYFEGLADEASLPGTIREALIEAHLNDWADRITTEAKLVRYPLGMKFVGRLSFFDALFGAPPKEPQATVPELQS